MTSPPETAVAYIRVSTDGQAESRAGLDAQRVAIDTDLGRRGWRLVETYTDTASGKSTRNRPGLDAALTAVRTGAAAALVVAKLDRLSRSVLDFATLTAAAEREGWRLVVIDLGIDLGTANGQLTATVLSGVAQWERQIIGARTRDALAAKRAQGVRLGRPRTLSDEVIRDILGRYRDGRSMAGIAADLTAEGVATARGGPRWYASTVQAVLRSQAASALS